jgi:hypothetical protein
MLYDIHLIHLIPCRYLELYSRLNGLIPADSAIFDRTFGPSLIGTAPRIPSDCDGETGPEAQREDAAGENFRRSSRGTG